MTKKRDREKKEARILEPEERPWMIDFRCRALIVATSVDAAVQALSNTLNDERVKRAAGKNGIARWFWKPISATPTDERPGDDEQIAIADSRLVGLDGRPLRRN